MRSLRKITIQSIFPSPKAAKRVLLGEMADCAFFCAGKEVGRVSAPVELDAEEEDEALADDDVSGDSEG